MPLPGSYVYTHHKQYGLIIPENYDDIYIYNNDRKWWGSAKEQKELEQAYHFLENFLKDHWEKF